MAWHPPYQKITAHGKEIILRLQSERDRAAGVLRVERPLLGCEVGVFRGHNSATLLARMPQLGLFMVDFWGHDAPESEQSIQGTDQVVAEALANTAFAANRRIIIATPSPSGAEVIRSRMATRGADVVEPPVPGSAAAEAAAGRPFLDFVFVDGDHRYEPCMVDFRAWWPLVKPGGLLFGHDIRNPHPWARDWGVDRAAEEFAAEVGSRLEVWEAPAMLFCLEKAR